MSGSEGPRGWYLYFRSDEYPSGTYGPLNMGEYEQRAQATEVATRRKAHLSATTKNARDFMLMWREPLLVD